VKRVTFLAATALAIAAVAYAWQTAGPVGPVLPLRLVGDFPLTGNTTRFDYASLDAERGVIWVAHMGDGSIEAFDMKSNRVTLTVPISPKASIRGVIAARGDVYAAAQGLASIVVVDGSSGKRLATVRAGDVDGLAYDPVTQRAVGTPSSTRGRTRGSVPSSWAGRRATPRTIPYRGTFSSAYKPATSSLKSIP
jgi:hypothetical protein